MSSTLAIASLFGSSFLSATLLPGNSEILLVTLLTAGSAPALMLVLSATVGNTLGANKCCYRAFITGIKATAWDEYSTRLASTLWPSSFIVELVTDSGRFDVCVGRLVAYALGSCRFFLCLGKALRYIVLTMITLQGIAWWQ